MNAPIRSAADVVATDIPTRRQYAALCHYLRFHWRRCFESVGSLGTEGSYHFLHRNLSEAQQWWGSWCEKYGLPPTRLMFMESYLTIRALESGWLSRVGWVYFFEFAIYLERIEHWAPQAVPESETPLDEPQRPTLPAPPGLSASWEAMDAWKREANHVYQEWRDSIEERWKWIRSFRASMAALRAESRTLVRDLRWLAMKQTDPTLTYEALSERLGRKARAGDECHPSTFTSDGVRKRIQAAAKKIGIRDVRQAPRGRKPRQ